ncbi:MAG: hypothetical protein ACP5KZ_05755 [bacterium]
MKEEKTLQESLWPEEAKSSDSKRIFLLFRNTIPEIPSTTYGTFAIYKYPAKFIPQVIAYVLKKYARPGMRIFDPFAGYGTAGIVARVYGYDYELWDLNPLLNIIHDTAVMKMQKVDVKALIEELKTSGEEFIPSWSNLRYWFPNEFIPLLAKAWGFVHSLNDEKKYLLIIPLVNVTRYFSFGDEKVHKLYKSKYSRKKIAELLAGDWEAKFYDMLEKEIYKLLKKVWEYNRLKPKEVRCKVKGGIDSLEEDLEEDVNILITSPPYLQAQEYIRSTKLELFWLGYREEDIKELSKKEIPYREVERIKILSSKYYEFREKISEPHLRSLYERYFNAVLNSLSRLGKKVKDYMCIFVGPAKIRTIPIPIDEIIIEHLSALGWSHEVTFIDKIVGRVMFETRINPASQMEDSRIKTEHLVIMKRG